MAPMSPNQIGMSRNVSTWYTLGRGFESLFGPHPSDWDFSTSSDDGLDEYEIAQWRQRLGKKGETA